MKKPLIKFFDKIILLLLGLSGILYSCAKYGALADEFEIKGTVTDSSKKPIKDIRIIRERYYDRGDTLYTNSDGKYSIKLYGEYHINSGVPIHLKIDDVDGEANGGEFISTELDVKFTNADLVKKGYGNKRNNKYVKTLNIQLEKDEIIPMYGVLTAPFEP
jgi:putative lipoprotein (rSAM/lipoprotein system)